jgi:hypothetical protein
MKLALALVVIGRRRTWSWQREPWATRKPRWAEMKGGGPGTALQWLGKLRPRWGSESRKAGLLRCPW